MSTIGMTAKRCARCATAILWILLLTSPAAGQPPGVTLPIEGDWQLHQMRVEGPGAYRVIGADPYLFTPNFSYPLQSVAGVLLDISLIGGNGPATMQLFFGVDDRNWSEALSFRFTPNPSGETFVPFRFFGKAGAFRENASLVSLRMDVDGCSRCLMVLQKAFLVNHSDQTTDALVPPDLTEPDLPDVLPIAPDISAKGDWALHDIEAVPGGGLRVVGNDPFLESPMLHVPLHRIKGVHLRMQFPGRSGYRKMQLFWSTYNHHYDELHSILFETKIQSGMAEVFLPFRDIAPANDLLRCIRLDLMDAAGLSFRLVAARLVEDPEPSLLERAPLLVVQPPASGFDGDRFLSDLAQRAGRDRTFFVLLGGIVVITVGAMIWLWRSGDGGGRGEGDRN